jgi:hypothetical protein
MQKAMPPTAKQIILVLAAEITTLFLALQSTINHVP